MPCHVPPNIQDVYPEVMPLWEARLPKLDYSLSNWHIPRYTSYTQAGIGDALRRFIDENASNSTPFSLNGTTIHDSRAGYCALHRFLIICELWGLHGLRNSKTKNTLIAYNYRMLAVTEQAFALYSEERQALRSTYFTERVLRAADLYAWLNALINTEERLSHPSECRHEVRTEMATIEFYADVAFTEFRQQLTDEAYRQLNHNNRQNETYKRKFKINHVRVPEPNNCYGTIPESFSIGNSAKMKVRNLDTVDAGEHVIIRTEFVLPKEDYEIEHRFSTRVVSSNQPNTGSDNTVLQPTSNVQQSRAIDI